MLFATEKLGHASSFLAYVTGLELAVFVTGALLVFGLMSWLVWSGRASIALGLCLAVSVVQVFQPAGYLSFGLITCVSTLPALLLRHTSRSWNTWTIALLSLAAVQTASLLWSPKAGATALAVLSSLALISVFLLTRLALRLDGGLRVPLLITAPVLAVEAGLVVLFRLVPAIEFAYLDSLWSPWLSEPEVRLISVGGQVNVFDEAKSGGLLLNANIASLLLVLASLLFFWQWTVDRKWYFVSTAMLAAVGVIATGSKTPILLTATLGGAGAVVFLCARRKWRLLAPVLIVFAAGAAAIVLSGVTREFADSMQDRWRLWGLAMESFPQHPLLGLGYGGWTEYIEVNFVRVFGTDRPFQLLPPHNFIVQAWADAGIPLAIGVTIAAIVPIVWASSGLFGERSEHRWRRAIVWVAVCWAPLHAVGDTTGFFGENHTLAFFAAFVAISYSARARSTSSMISPRSSALESHE